jgi:hypothetical protein
MAHTTGHSGQLGLTKRSSVQDGGKPRKSTKIQEKDQNRIGQPRRRRRRGKRDRDSKPYKNTTTTKKKKKGQRERATESNKQTSKQSKPQKAQ